MRAYARLLCLGLATACGPPHPVSQDGGPVEVLLPFPGDGGLTWDGWVGPFVLDYCVQCHSPTANCGGSGCHQPGDPALFDLRDESAVLARAGIIQCGIATQQDPAWSCGSTVPRAFPVENGGNPLPNDAQRALVVQWIDAGCP